MLSSPVAAAAETPAPAFTSFRRLQRMRLRFMGASLFLSMCRSASIPGISKNAHVQKTVRRTLTGVKAAPYFRIPFLRLYRRHDDVGRRLLDAALVPMILIAPCPRRKRRRLQPAAQSTPC